MAIITAVCEFINEIGDWIIFVLNKSLLRKPLSSSITFQEYTLIINEIQKGRIIATSSMFLMDSFVCDKNSAVGYPINSEHIVDIEAIFSDDKYALRYKLSFTSILKFSSVGV